MRLIDADKLIQEQDAFDLEAHDSEIRADERKKVFEEIEEALNEYLFDSPMMNPIMTRNEILLFLNCLKEQKNEKDTQGYIRIQRL